MAINTDQIIKQSLSAIEQHRDVWKKHCKYVSKYDMKPLKDFFQSGVGRACLVVANGYSLELEMETIKKYRDRVDILCCDKSLGHLIKAGIKPQYCIVADANVNYEKYMEPWKDDLQDTVIFQNVCANTKWVDNGNWKDRYFFVCKDAVGSEEVFSKLSGCKNFIAAGTNVSNGMVIFLTQSDNEGRKNFFGYDKILLIGFDYSWPVDGNYYAYDHDGGGKKYYMRHIYGRNIAGNLCYTSNNLSFSMQWLKKYIDSFNLPVIQCTKHTVFQTKIMGKLDEQMQFSHKPEDSNIIKVYSKKKRELLADLAKIESGIKDIQRDHYFAYMAAG